jgi:hypothetical protein
MIKALPLSLEEAMDLRKAEEGAKRVTKNTTGMFLQLCSSFIVHLS